jgi:hypothetical protein
MRNSITSLKAPSALKLFNQIGFTGGKKENFERQQYQPFLLLVEDNV